MPYNYDKVTPSGAIYNLTYRLYNIVANGYAKIRAKLQTPIRRTRSKMLLNYTLPAAHSSRIVGYQ